MKDTYTRKLTLTDTNTHNFAPVLRTVLTQPKTHGRFLFPSQPRLIAGDSDIYGYPRVNIATDEVGELRWEALSEPESE